MGIKIATGIAYGAIALTVASALTSCGAPSHSPGENTGAPPPVTGGIPSSIATADARKIDALFERYRKSDSPGCAVGVLREGKLVFSGAYGLANIEHAKRLDRSSRFNIGSISKQFTALSILILEQQKKLSLTDDITKYLPEIPHYQRRITIRDLLEHTSGLRDQDELMKLAGFHTYVDLLTNRDYLALISRQKELNFLPGTEAVYSDSGYLLLGQIIERVSGMSVGQFEAVNIFRPLQMEHTVVRDDHSMVIGDMAEGYIKKGDGSWHTAVTNDESTGAGNIVTTIEDFARWDRNFYTHGVGGAESIAAMETPGHFADQSISRYGLGLQIGTDQGYSTIEHGGADAGYHSFYVRYPEAKLSTVVFCNVREGGESSPSRLARAVAGIFLAKRAEPAPDEANTSALPGAPMQGDTSDYAGTYFRAEDGSVIVFQAQGQSLSEIDDVTDMKSAVALSAVAPGRFRSPENVVTTFLHENGSIIAVQSAKGTTATFSKRSSASTSAGDLVQFAGDYYSDELNASWKIAVSGGKVILRRPRFNDEVLLPVFRDGFYGEQWTLLFSRDANHKVSAVSATNERIRALPFRRLN